MAFIDITEWTAIQTTEWLSGLDDCILPYVKLFLDDNVNGSRLLLLSGHDLHRLNVTKVGHQEIILEGIHLLNHLQHELGFETLQTLALQLGCKARSLYSQLKRDSLVSGEHGDLPETSSQDNVIIKVSTDTLSSVGDIMKSVKTLVRWIDR